MQIPSVSSLFHARVGSLMGQAPVSAASSESFASQYAAALGGAQGAQELTVVSPTVNQATLPVSGAYLAATQVYSPVPASRAMPMYIPAASVKPVSTGAAGATTGQQVVDFAKQFVGTPYVAGGEDLVKGADCSGFVQSVYAHFGVKLPRSSYRQSKVGAEVDVKDLRPGDLLFFKTADYAPVTHVAMYVGDGKIIHASSKKTGVIISKLRIKDDFVIARRLL